MQTQEITEKRSSSVFTTGLALFSMFFGAGNLIFPLLMGQAAGRHVGYALLGMGLTAVVVPFLGLITMLLFQARYDLFFQRIGKMPGKLLLLFLQLILGPLGVIPRLVTLMQGASTAYGGDIPAIFPMLLIGGLIFVCSLKKQRLVGLLGVYFTPILLLSLVALMIFGLAKGSALPTSSSASSSFWQGLLGGYNTMDLIAAFLFSGLVLPHFQGRSARDSWKKMTLASLLAASLLFLTYIGLSLVAAYHAALFSPSCPPEEMLGLLATHLLGRGGGAIATIAVLIACFTTAITLTSIFADYLHDELCRKKISRKGALLVTVGITIVFASLGFRSIAAFLGPILQVIYPALIVLTLVNFGYVLYRFRYQ